MATYKAFLLLLWSVLYLYLLFLSLPQICKIVLSNWKRITLKDLLVGILYRPLKWMSLVAMSKTTLSCYIPWDTALPQQLILYFIMTINLPFFLTDNSLFRRHVHTKARPQELAEWKEFWRNVFICTSKGSISCYGLY